jgi:hypothetical protein
VASSSAWRVELASSKSVPTTTWKSHHSAFRAYNPSGYLNYLWEFLCPLGRLRGACY